MKSKFGTLALVRDSIEIYKNKFSLQIGRTYIEAMLIEAKESNFIIRNTLRYCFNINILVIMLKQVKIPLCQLIMNQALILIN